MKDKHLFDNVTAGVLAVVVHVAFVLLLVFNLDWRPKPTEVGNLNPFRSTASLESGFMCPIN